FYCYVDHLDLHSFPTRRSSDLKHERPFEPRRVRIVKFLVHRGNCYLVRDARVDLDIIHLHWREHVRARRTHWPRWPGRNWPRRKDRKSTRLNSSHVAISYAVFC